MPPPPAEPLAARIFLGPALRAQPDRRLVALVREGYETAFEEIVRRYRKPLDRFAAAIVGNRSEDVTQDAFSKALLALRGSQTDIELKPWLYRIVRNTALNDLRDGPPPAEELAETIPGGLSAAAEAEGRAETAELMRRLRALPDPQRAAIVMRELEGLSHEEIATALGVSGGAARQAIYRARAALRDGLGLLVPLPLLRVLFDHGAEAAGAGGAAAAAGAAAAGGGGATLGALGAGGALKVGVATALIAGSVGAGVAIQHDRGARGGAEPAAAAVAPPGTGAAPGGTPSVGTRQGFSDDGGHRGGDDVGQGSERRGDRHGSGGGGPGEDGHSDLSPHRGPGSDRSGHGGRGSGHDDDSGSSGDRSGEGASGGRHSGHHGSGGSGDGGRSSGSSGEGISGSGKNSGSSGKGGGGESSGGSGDDASGRSGGSGTSGSSGSSGHHSGSAQPAPVLSPPPPTEPTTSGDDSGSDSSGSGSGSSSGGDGGS